MTAKIDGTNGLLQSYDYQTPSTGFSYTFAAGTQMLFMVPASTLATGTITMPSAPADGMMITFSSSQQITALTLQGNSGQSISGAVTFLPAQSAVSYVYRLANTTWYPCESVPGTGSQLVLATAQTTTSGTTKDFTGIPSWVKRITFMVSGVGSSGSSPWILQIGSGSFETSSYLGATQMPGVTTIQWSTGAMINAATNTGLPYGGNAVLTLFGSNTWSFTVQTARSTQLYNNIGAGTKTISGTLDRIRLTTVNGTDTFNSGSINILYE